MYIDIDIKKIKVSYNLEYSELLIRMIKDKVSS